MRSSVTISRMATAKPRCSRTFATAGPERSSRSPRAQESLTVTTAAVIFEAEGLAVEENIFLFFLLAFCGSGCRRGSRCSGRGSWLRLTARLALRFVKQAQALHQ